MNKYVHFIRQPKSGILLAHYLIPGKDALIFQSVAICSGYSS